MLKLIDICVRGKKKRKVFSSSWKKKKDKSQVINLEILLETVRENVLAFILL